MAIMERFRAYSADTDPLPVSCIEDVTKDRESYKLLGACYGNSLLPVMQQHFFSDKHTEACICEVLCEKEHF